MSNTEIRRQVDLSFPWRLNLAAIWRRLELTAESVAKEQATEQRTDRALARLFQQRSAA